MEKIKRAPTVTFSCTYGGTGGCELVLFVSFLFLFLSTLYLHGSFSPTLPTRPNYGSHPFMLSKSKFKSKIWFISLALLTFYFLESLYFGKFLFWSGWFKMFYFRIFSLYLKIFYFGPWDHLTYEILFITCLFRRRI